MTAEEYLKEHGISQASIEKFGLKDLGNKLGIPIKDGNGKVEYYIYRNLDFSENNPLSKKFIFDSGHTARLFNEEALKKYKNYVFLCEGMIDCIRLVQEGLLAVSGTAGVNTFKEEWIEKFISKDVFILFDNDDVGKKAAKEIGQKLAKVGAKVRIVQLPEGYKDVCEFMVQGHTKSDIPTLLKKSIPVEPEEHKSIVSNKVPWPPPLSETAFIGIAGEVVRIIEPHSEADPIALLMNFLIAFGSIIGDKPHIKVESDKHSMRLFAVLVGETSKARKGTSWGYIKNIFGGIDDVWKRNIQTGLSSGEGVIWAVRDEITKKKPIKKDGQIVDYVDEIVDEGITDKRLLVIEPEFASTLRVLGRDGNTLSPIIRSSWDSGDLQSLTKNSPAKASGAHISIIGHITRQELIRYLTETEAANGFGNRFLWFLVKRSKALAFGGEFHKVNLSSLVEKIIEAIFFSNGVDKITWADEAKPLWLEVYPKLSDGKQGLIGSMTARAEAHVIRLASIYALLDLSNTISSKHLKAALAIWNYAEESTKFIFQNRAGNTLADQIFDFLEQHPEGSTRTDISNYFARHKSSEQISEALILLETLGLAKKELTPGEGRTVETWFVERSSEKSEEE